LNQKVDKLLTTKWDKSAKSTALLYFDEDIKIFKVDDKEKLGPLGLGPSTFEGSGTQKVPKAHLVIPSGERKLSLGFKRDLTGTGTRSADKIFGDRRYEVTYAFVANRCYQLSASYPNKDFLNPKVADIAKREDELQKKIDAQAELVNAATKAKNNAEAVRLSQEMGPLRDEVLKLAGEKAMMWDGYATNIIITDITGGKKKNSPSIIVVVKPWEQK